MSEAPVATPAATTNSNSNANLIVRILTALVAVPLILLLLFKGPPWGFFALVFPASLIAAWELFNMTHQGDRPSQWFGVFATGLASAGLFFGDAKTHLTIFVVLPMLGPLFTLIRLGDMKTAAARVTALGFGTLFTGIPLTLLALLRRDIHDGAGYVLLSLLFAWLSDTGGYFAGRFLGKHKLYEAVSPKKTVEGAVGGLLGAVLGAVVASLTFLPTLPIARGVILAVVAASLGQAGDLGESILKRSTGVKDSGAIVPGHGGILDRVDALMLTSAVVYLYAIWFAA